ncbi:ABC transporter ATP-binding protein [Solilutibacter silvestris]|uniref:ABC transporter ATP-binding protein n=1 Tax=Solilutibacter silvestris TaxID=1645665 RepID=UPI003D332C46
MSSEIAIQVQGLSKCYEVYSKPLDRLMQFVAPAFSKFRSQSNFYKEFWALSDINFEVHKGESVGILGRNGSGKSTLLQLITGTLAPTTGVVRTSGRISALLELGSGFHPDFTGRENVHLGGAMQGWSPDEMDQRFAAIAQFADIGEFMDMPVKTYSSGMYARLAFSAAIHTDPEILIVDEILAVGDSAFQQKCIKRIYSMMDRGVSVLLVSHDAYQVRSICQKALVLRNGRQVFFGTATRGMDEYISILSEAEQEPGADGQNFEPDVQSDAPEIAPTNGFAITIHDVEMRNPETTGCTDAIQSGDPVEISFEYRVHGQYDGDLSFVINLYRDDGIYVFGATTSMRKLAPYDAMLRGRVTAHFPSLKLVSGNYKWRVAVNDGRGLHIIAEAVPVCPFVVEDDFRAVGVYDIDHDWHAVAIVG